MSSILSAAYYCRKFANFYFFEISKLIFRISVRLRFLLFSLLLLGLLSLSRISFAQSPYQVCTGDTVIFSVPNTYIGIQWYKDGNAISGENQATFKATDIGSYSYTAFSPDCPIISNVNIVLQASSTCGINPCTTPNAGTDISLCSPKNTFDLKDALSTEHWSFLNGQTNASIDANTGIVTGMSQPGVYQFVLSTAAAACADTVKITVLPTPSSSQTVAFCAGGSALLKVSGGTNYNWITGQTTDSLRVNSTGNYSVNIIDALGCGSIVNFGVMVSPKPTFSLTSKAATCINGVANNDGWIYFSNTGTAKFYSYNLTTFNILPTQTTGTTLITGSSEFISQNISNISSPTYYVRAFTDKGCFRDSSIIITPVSCTIPCTKPSYTLISQAATCQNDALIFVKNIQNVDKYVLSLGTTYTGDAYANAITISGSNFSIPVLGNNNVTTSYTVRIFNGGSACFYDQQVVLQPTICQPPTTCAIICVPVSIFVVK